MERFDVQGILKKDFLITVFIVFTTPWIWKITNYNVFLCLLLILITIILVKLLLIDRLHTALILILCGAFLIASVINFRLGFDQELNKLNFNEEIQIDERHKYYARELGELFLNKYSLNYYKNYNPYIYKLERNFFSVLDPNLYFFASHPRERAGINEFEKFPSLYFMFFIMGILYSLKLRSLLLMLYLLVAASINGFISPAFELGPVLFFPFVTTLIVIGVVYSIDLLRFLIRKIH